MDLLGKSRAQGPGEVVGRGTSGEPVGGQVLQSGTVGGGQDQLRCRSAELGEDAVRGGGRRGRSPGLVPLFGYVVGGAAASGLGPRGCVTVEEPVPPFAVTCGTGPVRAEHPARTGPGVALALSESPYAAQVPGSRQLVEGGADGLLAVERLGVGEGLGVHRGAFGKPVDEGGEVGLAGGEVSEVPGAGGPLVRCGSLAVPRLGHGVCGGRQGGVRVFVSHGIAAFDLGARPRRVLVAPGRGRFFVAANLEGHDGAWQVGHEM